MARFGLLTLRRGRRYNAAMDRSVNSAPRTGIQFARKKQILIFITGGIVLTQADVRKMQLAVAAIKSGVRMMLEEAGLGVSDLDGIFVAGAFGGSLNVRNAMAVGLLPSLPENKVFFVGNSSLAGARKLLLSGPERRMIESYPRKIKHISLASGRAFQD